MRVRRRLSSMSRCEFRCSFRDARITSRESSTFRHVAWNKSGPITTASSLDSTGRLNALRSVHDGVAAEYAPHSHHASARSAVVACAVGHFKIVAATQTKCRHCDEMAGESKR